MKFLRVTKKDEKEELYMRLTRFDENKTLAETLRNQAKSAGDAGNFALALNLIQKAEKALMESNRAILGS